MLKEITMPAGGQTTDVSTIGTWLVKKGDKVKRGDPLLEIETDKATLTVESFAKGTVLDILVEEGDEVSAGTVIAYIGEEGDLPAGGAAQSGGAVQSVDTSQTDSTAQTGGYHKPVRRQESLRIAKKSINRLIKTNRGVMRESSRRCRMQN